MTDGVRKLLLAMARAKLAEVREEVRDCDQDVKWLAACDPKIWGNDVRTEKARLSRLKKRLAEMQEAVKELGGK